jgi:ferredoxin-thioredoxin reductase catalytic subunit
MKCVEELRGSNPDFNPIDLDFDTAYFGGIPPEWLDSGMKSDKERILMIIERDKVLRMWKAFAEQNNLKLAWFTDLVLRAGCVVQQEGACPCLPEERSACPCEEVINECQEKGQCHCRVFLSEDFKARIGAKG